MDHFRPKRQPRLATPAGHPGYFWLAYNWKNLLPTCPHCNSKFKLNHFPVLSAHAAENFPKPESLDDIEKPLLLCPYGTEDPRLHLEFQMSGDVFARAASPRGQATIKYLGLNERPLIRRRNAAISNALLGCISEMTRVERNVEDTIEEFESQVRKAFEDYLKRFELGVSEYSVPILETLKQVLPSMFEKKAALQPEKAPVASVAKRKRRVISHPPSIST